jgi:hypothetical protein
VQQIRAQIYGELNKRKVQNEMATRTKHQGQTIGAVGSVTATDFSSFYNNLIVRPEQESCYETLAILNYFGFPFHVEEDNIYGSVKKEMGFHKHDEYPLFLVDSTTDGLPPTEQTGMQDILTFLYNH